jgi:hypothetical protein
MFKPELTNAVHSFVTIMLPISEKDLETSWAWKDHDEEGIRFAFFVSLQELRQLAVTLASMRKQTTQAQHSLSRYHAQYRDLQAAILGLTAEDSERAPAQDEWPVRRIYAHILTAEINFTATVRYALEKHRAGMWTPERMSDEDDIRLTGLTEEKYKALMDSPLEVMLAYHRDLHLNVIHEFSSITDDELDMPSTFWEETRFPIRHRLHRFEAHLVQHTVQIDKSLVLLGLAPGETKRLTRHIYAALADAENMMIGQELSNPAIESTANSLQARTKEIRELLEN